MSEKTIMILMGILSVGFAGIIGFSIMTSDRTAPEISFPDNEITYTEGSDTAPLLDGVSAIDDCNGDVSESVCIDSIIPNTEEGKATVVYAAYDFSNNVAKAKRSIAYVATSSREESTSEEITEEATERAEATTEAEAETEEEAVVNPEAPVLVMAVNEFSIETGGPFTPKNRVQSVEDDVDSSDYLMNHLQVVGDYDIDTVGRYELEYYVIDSSGNESNHEPMTLIVEEATSTQQRASTTQQTNRTQNQTQIAQQPTQQPAQQPVQQPEAQQAEQQPVQQSETQQPEQQTAQQPETQPAEQQPVQ
ncbi:MAG: immunoglobulin-like domain-containing protein [Lachnospiraceae bacterium]